MVMCDFSSIFLQQSERNIAQILPISSSAFSNFSALSAFLRFFSDFLNENLKTQRTRRPAAENAEDFYNFELLIAKIKSKFFRVLEFFYALCVLRFLLTS